MSPSSGWQALKAGAVRNEAAIWDCRGSSTHSSMVPGPGPEGTGSRASVAHLSRPVGSGSAPMPGLGTFERSGTQEGKLVAKKTSWATRCHAFVCLFLPQPVEWFEALHRRLGLPGNQQPTYVESGINVLARVDGLVVLSTSGEHIPTEQPSDHPYPISHTTIILIVT